MTMPSTDNPLWTPWDDRIEALWEEYDRQSARSVRVTLETQSGDLRRGLAAVFWLSARRDIELAILRSHPDVVRLVEAARALREELAPLSAEYLDAALAPFEEKAAESEAGS